MTTTEESLEKSAAGPPHRAAGLICLFGFFLHIVLSGPLLDALGFHYAADDGKFYEKIHPGTIFIFMSFIVLLWDRGHPVRDALRLLRDYPEAVLLLLLYILIFIYLALRSGPAGLAFLIDTHMTVPMAAIVLSCAPSSYCRRALGFFIAVAALNSLIGIAEAAGKFRIFTFDPDWPVLKETYFRASALRGHPLANATFTVIALFLTLGTRLPAFVKIILAPIFLASLIAFGSRAALVFCTLGLFALGIAYLWRLAKSGLTLRRMFLIAAVAVLAPVGFAAFLYALLHSGIGDRLMATAYWDKSANSRLLALSVFRYMRPDEIILGSSSARILDITAHLNAVAPLGGIENPWLLMFLYLGTVAFPFWLLATLAFIRWLVRDQMLTAQGAALGYFLIASTYNSFGSKEDSTYLIMTCAVVCARRAYAQMIGVPTSLTSQRLRNSV